MEFVDKNNLFNGNRFLIFGCGIAAIGFLKSYKISPDSILGFVESKKSTNKFSGEEGIFQFDGKPIFSIDEIASLDFDFIFIANQHYQTLKQTLEIGIPIEKIIITTQKVYEEFKRDNPSKKIRCAFTSVLTQKFQLKNSLNERFATFNEKTFLFSNDYVRLETLQLLADQIYQQNVQGEIAELGVFQGDFAQYLNQLFPDRALNLFDTFSGNTSDELNKSIAEGTLTQTASNILSSYFGDTSIDLVMSKMKYPNQIQIYKGFFPDTIPSEPKKFALVEMDIDLHKPTLAGLKYFYANLSIGGFIMLSCYNSFVVSDGLHCAVKDLEKEFGHIAKVPIPDEYGTLIITK